MSDAANPDTIYTALCQIKSRLPLLIGASDWSQVSEQFHEQLNQLKHSNDESEKLRLSASLVGMLVPYPSVHKQLKLTMEIESKREKLIDVQNNIMPSLVSLAKEMGLDTTLDTNSIETSMETALQLLQVEEAESNSTYRLLIISKGGIGKGQSIKLKNLTRLTLDFAQISELTAGLILMNQDKALNPLLVTAGVLLIIHNLIKTTTIDIDEQEVSVFWGFIQASHGKKDMNVDEKSVLKHTNSERKKVGLSLLTNAQVKNSLHKLKLLKSIELVDSVSNTWRMIETYRIQE